MWVFMKIMMRQKLLNLLRKVMLQALVFDENTDKTETSKFTLKRKAIAFGFWMKIMMRQKCPNYF